ncbi:MAG: hypothetical protein HQL55_08795 [Magnetococcales bacterium]|nr:hypothetical protein [Magnetococcales bacterium]
MIHPPRSARWFHLVGHPGEIPAAISLLANFRQVQLEDHDSPSPAPELIPLLDKFRQLEERFVAYWPAIGPVPDHYHAPSVLHALQDNLTRLENWCREAEPLITTLQKLQADATELQLLEDLTSRLAGGVLNFSLWRDDGDDTIASAIFVLPPQAILPPLPDNLLMTILHGEKDMFLMVAGEQQALASYRQLIFNAHGRFLPIANWMRTTPEAALEKIRQRRQKMDKKLAGVHIDLARLADVHQLSLTLPVLYRLRWYHQQAKPVVEGQLTHITGWTSESEAESLNLRLQEHGVQAMVGLPPPPAVEPPMILDNPPWAKPFQLFPAMLGVPGRHEVDPSRLLALLMPLLFGFMFGDVGQGPVLALVGYWLARHKNLDMGWLLVAGGLSATLFGLLFGSLFCLEHVIPALWLHPLSHPMTLLAVPLALGVVIVSGGMALEGVQSHWRGEGSRWWYEGMGMMVAYWSILGVFLTHWSWGIFCLAVLLMAVGNYRHHGGWHGLFHLAHVPETLMQLAVNTLSFSRVGAFALAHAGLSQAVVALADLAGNPISWLLVLLIGNVIILVLEGLVVSVQTTRLMLFEFFIRFLKGEGRLFVPTPPPPVAVSSL